MLKNIIRKTLEVSFKVSEQVLLVVKNPHFISALYVQQLDFFFLNNCHHKLYFIQYVNYMIPGMKSFQAKLQLAQAYYLKIQQKFQFSKIEFLKQCVVLKIKICSTFQKLLSLKLCN